MPLATMQKRALFLGVGVLMKTMPDDAQNTSHKQAYNNLNNSALKRHSEPVWEKHFWVDKSWTQAIQQAAIVQKRTATQMGSRYIIPV